MRQRLSGTRREVAIYLALTILLVAGALILGDLVIGIGAGLAGLALAGALSARRREVTEDDAPDQ